jgi:hypothetical protein
MAQRDRYHKIIGVGSVNGLTELIATEGFFLALKRAQPWRTRSLHGVSTVDAPRQERESPGKTKSSLSP